MRKTMEGKTDQARADLARLAIIKKRREEENAKKQAEVEAKAEASSAKQESLNANKGKLNAYGF
jgi:Casein kinase substrate phosphoprotein PP28